MNNYNNPNMQQWPGCAAQQPETPLSEMPLAMAYVPMQQYRNLYDTPSAILRGTIFQELDLPFRGKMGCC